MYYIVGLGNPGEEYANTRHNIGRMAVEIIAEEFIVEKTKFGSSKTGASRSATPALFKADKVLRADKCKVDIEEESAVLLLPNTFMNKSGASIVPLIPPGPASAKKAKKLIVIHDDIDLPLGQIRIVFNRGAGGHNGVTSIVRAIKTEAFVRIKIGIVPTTPGGKLKKPKGGEKVVDFILGQFQSSEMQELKKVLKKIPEIVSVIVNEGELEAMNRFN